MFFHCLVSAGAARWLGTAGRARSRLHSSTIKSSDSTRQGAMARGTLPLSPQRDAPGLKGHKTAMRQAPPLCSSPLFSPPPRNLLFDGIFTPVLEINQGSQTALQFSLEYRRFKRNRFFQCNIFPKDSSALQRLFLVLPPRE